VASVKGEHLAPVPLCARDHCRVGQPERKIGIAPNKLANAREVVFSVRKCERMLLEIEQERVKNVDAEALFNQIADFDENPGWDKVRGPYACERLSSADGRGRDGSATRRSPMCQV
jgi:hypothetical protein